ncbi:nucleolar protein 58 [Durio zibethinus]|uniref:Nucleolar protein 58 n=1 Tax=Durio zibethinus TaxID=66656 RepID=A0A6P5X0U4_DURZI|nr:nucleolar protein 58 [Durio zibethinus]
MVAREIEELSEEERRALRGSKFAPLPCLPTPSRSQPRLAHPGGPLTTNKAAALAKFLERKLQDPNGLSSINPDLLELAVNNAKATVFQSGASNLGSMVRHVDSFGDSEDSLEEANLENPEPKKGKKKKKNKNKKEKNKNKNKKKKVVEDHECKLKRPKKKVKL